MIENLKQYDIPIHRKKIKEHYESPIEHKIWWLKNSFDDDIWELDPHIETEERARYTVNWNIYDLENYNGIFHRWDYWKNAAKELAYWVMEAPESKCHTTSSLAQSCRNIREFYEWLCFERKCFELSAVKQEDIVSFCENISTRKLTQNTVLSKFIVISHAYTLRKYLVKSLSFNPFKLKKANILAKAYSVQNGHTPTLYPKEVFSLLNHALKLVRESRHTLELLEKYMEIHSDKLLSHRSTYVRFYKLTGVKSSELHSKVRILYGAAITIILILLAERKHELSLNKNDDVLALLNNEIDMLVGLEKKTAKTITGKRTERAVIQEVKDALTVILKITSYTQEKSKKDTILLKIPFGHSSNGIGEKNYYLTTNGLYRILEHFAESANFNRIKLRPHMFRRAYAMLWTWRFEIGDFEDLSVMLKHNNANFTKKYIDDENIWEFMGDTERELTFDILNRAFQGKILMNGQVSETLERYSRLIQAKSILLDAPNISDFVDEFILANEIRVISHSDGYCFISNRTHEVALCRTEGVGLDPIKRNDSLCVKCPNFAIDNSRKAHWEKRIMLHQEVVSSSKNEKLQESSKVFIVNAKRILSSMK